MYLIKLFKENKQKVKNICSDETFKISGALAIDSHHMAAGQQSLGHSAIAGSGLCFLRK